MKILYIKALQNPTSGFFNVIARIPSNLFCNESRDCFTTFAMTNTRFCKAFILIVILMISSLGFAQNLRRINQSGAMKTDEKILVGDKLFEEGLYEDAIKYYEEASDETDNPPEQLLFRLAECHRLLRNYKEAANSYKKVYDEKKNLSALSLYWLAKMEKASGNYSKASEYFKKFTEISKGKGDEKEYKEIALKESQSNTVIQKLLNDPTSSSIKEVGAPVNSANSDFAAITYKNGEIYFTSVESIEASKNIDLSKQTRGKLETVNVNRLYKSGSELKERKKVAIKLSSDLASIGSSTFSLDGNKLYYTICEEQLTGMLCNLYYSELVGDQWGSPIALDINDPSASSKHPMITSDEKGNEVLLFASNRRGSKGGFDIWSSKIENGKYGTPSNLSKDINSEADEITPFYDKKDQKLYFSSNGYIGLGEYDIFTSSGQLSGRSWTAPVNAGTPINSSADDYYFFLKEDHVHAFVSSNRPGSASEGHATCCDDIYLVTLTQEKKEEEKIPEDTVIVEPEPIAKEESKAEIPPPEKPKDDELDPAFIEAVKKYYEKSLNKTSTKAEYNNIIATYGNITNKDLVYKVQIGAYSKPTSNTFNNVKNLGHVVKTNENGLTKYFIGNPDKLLGAELLRKQVVEKGIYDAFIGVYYKGSRIGILALPK